MYVRPFIGAPCHSTYNDRLGSHLQAILGRPQKSYAPRANMSDLTKGQSLLPNFVRYSELHLHLDPFRKWWKKPQGKGLVPQVVKTPLTNHVYGWKTSVSFPGCTQIFPPTPTLLRVSRVFITSLFFLQKTNVKVLCHRCRRLVWSSADIPMFGRGKTF